MLNSMHFESQLLNVSMVDCKGILFEEARRKKRYCHYALNVALFLEVNYSVVQCSIVEHLN